MRERYHLIIISIVFTRGWHWGEVAVRYCLVLFAVQMQKISVVSTSVADKVGTEKFFLFAFAAKFTYCILSVIDLQVPQSICRLSPRAELEQQQRYCTARFRSVRVSSSQ